VCEKNRHVLDCHAAPWNVETKNGKYAHVEIADRRAVQREHTLRRVPQLVPREENMYEAGFDASWELDVFGGIRRGVEASTSQLCLHSDQCRFKEARKITEVSKFSR
jgi:hypothetical protein